MTTIFIEDENEKVNSFKTEKILHENGKTFLRIKARVYEIKINNADIAYLQLCSKCGEKLFINKESLDGRKKMSCFGCSIKMEKKIFEESIKSQQRFKLEKGYQVARHNLYGVHSFPKGKPPHHINFVTMKPVTKGWKILATFVFDEKWIKVKEEDHFKNFREGWKPFFEERKKNSGK